MLKKIDFIKDYLSDLTKRKQLFHWTIFILAAFLLLLLVWYFYQLTKTPKIIPTKTPRELQIEHELKKLEQLRQETPAFSEQEIQTQLKELEQIRQEQQPLPLTEQEIKKQLEELEKLRGL